MADTSDTKRHEGNPDIIYAGGGKFDDEYDAGVLCGTAFGGWSDTCTYDDAKAWKKQIQKYYASEFIPAYEDFENKLTEYELGAGNPDQQEAADFAVEIMGRYEQEIQNLTIKSGEDNNYYVSTVGNIVRLWDAMARSHDALKDQLPDQVDPNIRTGKSKEAKEREKREAGGPSINWGTVAIVAGTAGLVFVGYKLWNE
jgi:hypothetical protein